MRHATCETGCRKYILDAKDAACADAFVRRPSEAVGQGFDGLGGPSYAISKSAILGCVLRVLLPTHKIFRKDADRF